MGYAKNFAGCKTLPFRAKFLHAKNAWFHAFLSLYKLYIIHTFKFSVSGKKFNT